MSGMKRYLIVIAAVFILKIYLNKAPFVHEGFALLFRQVF